MLGLLLHGDDLSGFVELHDAEALGVVDVVAENTGPALLCVRRRLLQAGPEAAAVENVVSQHHGTAVVADELLAQQERLGQPVGRGLHLIAQPDAELASVPQQTLEIGQIRGGGDDENVPDPRHHQGGQGVIDHGLVIHRQQLLDNIGAAACQHRAHGVHDGALGQITHLRIEVRLSADKRRKDLAEIHINFLLSWDHAAKASPRRFCR